jgi:sugar phosphate isomerase/epimerase
MNRRAFLESSGAILAGFTVLRAAGPDIQFPTGPKDRLAVSSWPFRKLFSPHGGTMRLHMFPAMVVSRFGVKGIEPLNDHFPSSSDAYLSQFKEAVAKAGAHIVNIPVNPGGSLYDPNDQKRLAAISTAKHWIDIAGTLGSPSIRVSVEGPAGTQPDAAKTLESLKALSAYGAERNIVVNVENDDPHSEDAFFLTGIIDKADSPYLRALPDFCNSMIEKHGDESFNDSALKAMFSRAYNISHVKDSEMDGETLYRVNVSKCFDIAKAARYKGYFSMEWEGRGEPFGGTQKLIELSLRNLSR